MILHFKRTQATLLCAGALFSLAANASVTLAHRYSFNDGTARDEIGKADGKPVGGVLISKGAAQFDGSPGQRIELLSNGAGGINLNTYKAITLEAWYTADKEQVWQRVFDFGASGGLDTPKSMGSNNLHYVVMSVFKDTRAVISNANPSFQGEQAATAPTAPLNKQVHFAVVVDAKNITLFIDGVQASQMPLEDRTLAKLSNDFALLGHSTYGDNPTLSGSINEFRIYDGAATAAEVAASFKAGPDHPAIGVKK